MQAWLNKAKSLALAEELSTEVGDTRHPHRHNHKETKKKGYVRFHERAYSGNYRLILPA
jgi:hypothetical protein